jgi:diguanylate cyclase (GGDEF)-like protein
VPEVILFDGNARDALEILRAIRDEKRFAEAPILAVCGRGHGAELEELRSQGVDDFLNAEASKAEIQTRLEGAAALSRARDEIADLKAQMARQRRVDDLTGVMSRRFFFQQGHRETGRARRYGHKLSCLMLEIDHFRALCATFGDSTGETTLRTLATIIGQWTRDSDLVSRFADAKFAILLPETGVDGATAAREKILTALAAHKWTFEDRALPVTVSVGESELQPTTSKRQSEGEFIDEGRRSGRNRAVYARSSGWTFGRCRRRVIGRA